MNNFIHEQKKIVTNSKNENEFYSIIGSQDFLDSKNNPRVSSEDDIKVVAKKIYRDDGSIRYSIKYENGKFINPISIYGSKVENTFLDRICKSNDKFKEVNLKVFEMYLKFLKTKNTAWLNNVERETI
jgi:hypothetical protein